MSNGSIRPDKTEDQSEPSQSELQEFEKRTLRLQRVTNFLTAGLLVVTTVYAIFSYLQWQEMRSGGADTHALAVAATKQANAALETAQQTALLATQAKSQAEASQQQAAASNLVAKLTGTQVAATRDSARNDLRAWVGPSDFLPPDPPFAVGNQPRFRVSIFNSGKTPAIDIRTAIAWSALSARTPFVPAYKKGESLAVAKSQSVVYPGVHGILTTDPIKIALNKESIEAIRNHSWILYVYGRIDYRDVFGRKHRSTFCLWLNEDLISGSSCPTYNHAD